MIARAGAGDGGEQILSDIFVSYSSKDRGVAERVRDALVEAGYSVFWDQEIPPGTDWDSWLRDELVASRLVVALWSRASVASPNVRHEAIIARDAGKLLPVMLDELAPSDFPMGLFTVQALTIGRSGGEFSEVRESFLAEVREMLGGADAAPSKRKRRLVRRPRNPRLWLAAAAALLVALAAGLALWLAWPALSFDPAAPPVTAEALRAAQDAEGPARRRVSDAGARFLATDLSDLTSSWVWGVAQGIAAAPDEERLLTVRFFERLPAARQAACNCYLAYAIPQTVTNAWVVIASARLRRSPPDGLLETLLATQNAAGWWSISLDATLADGNAALHATALATIALAEARTAGVLPEPLRPRVDEALRRAVAWLNRGPEDGRQWADYPANPRPTRNLVFAAMATVASRLAGGPADGAAARAFAAALTELPTVAESFATAAYIDRANGQRYFDDYRHPAAPWTGLAAVLAYEGADTPTKRRLAPLIRQWLETDLNDPRLRRHDWMTGETLYLRALAVRALGGS